MSSKLKRLLLCGALAGFFYVPPASAGVFQLVEIVSTNLEERASTEEDTADKNDDAESETRTIQGAEASGELDFVGVLMRLMGLMP